MTEQQIIEFLIWFKKQPEIVKRAVDPSTIAKMYLTGNIESTTGKKLTINSKEYPQCDRYRKAKNYR